MDDLSAPLGKSPNPRHLRPAGLWRGIAAALGCCVLLFALWIALIGNPFAVPVAAVPTPSVVSAPAAPQPQPPSTPPTVVRGAAEGRESLRTITIIDGISGKREEVVIGGTSEASPPAPGAGTVERSGRDDGRR